MKKLLSLPSSVYSFLTQSFKQKVASPMFSWSELDTIDHFSWGLLNKKPRTSCVLEVSNDFYQTLLMLCGEEVGSIFYNFNCKTSLKQHPEKKTNTPFLLQGVQSYIDGTRMGPVQDVFAFWQLRRHQRGLLVAGLRAWRKGTLDAGILQALKKLVNKLYNQNCIFKKILIQCLHAFTL